jgi:hypothetical protein
VAHPSSWSPMRPAIAVETRRWLCLLGLVPVPRPEVIWSMCGASTESLRFRVSVRGMERNSRRILASEPSLTAMCQVAWTLHQTWRVAIEVWELESARFPQTLDGEGDFGDRGAGFLRRRGRFGRC